MRQRGPTATALSPGLYLDGHSNRVPCTDNSVSLTPPVDVYATTIPSKLAAISPVLSRIQSPHPLLLDHHMTSDLKKQKPELSARTGAVQLHSKLHRKHHKNRRIGLHQNNGDVGRSLHSLKVTIRRTSQSHKIDSTQVKPGTLGGGLVNATVANSSPKPTAHQDSSCPPGSNVSCDVPTRNMDNILPGRTVAGITQPYSSPRTSGVSTVGL
ncbi:unnamed protein product [Echinostoma caproni]|uniref:Histone deacetylase n=1 Tax=Echinostoma caproni TaxID=27848 RepID=A0A183AXG5_9TREM|nr:unnamed protein product [Echinostoma caproni]